MAISVSICAAASMIIKPCYQQSTNDPQLKRWSWDRKTSYGSHEFQTPRSGGGDGDKANIPVNRNHEGIVESRGTQTDYRESETQTSPWEPPYKLSCRTNENPEVLSLANSTWENGLPAGMHEVKIIQRMRMKKKWLEILPPMDTPSNIKICEAIISAIEANEWAFREAEIQFMMDSRMELMERMKEHNARVKDEKTVRRIERFASRLGQQRDKQILGIRGTFLREVRKLNRKHRASSAASYKMHRSDIIARYADPTSYLYAPKMHFGFGSEAGHEILDKTLLPETYVDRKLAVDDSTKWLPTDEELQNLESIRRSDQLCVRRTRWSDEKLRKLHSDLKAIRLNETKNEKKNRPTLMKRKYKLPALPVTPLMRKSDDGDNYWENNCLFLQKITRGRAVQCMMFEGRDRCRELIEELRSIHLPGDSEEIASHRSSEVAKVDESRGESEKSEENNRLREILDSLEGLTVAGILDMLSKEETRLREERKAHALALLVERERTRREAEESGRRQLERNRRRELDEMFRQMVKVNQDSVQAYLEDVISEEMERNAEKDASRYVEELAEEIDAATLRYQEQKPDGVRDRQMIADMVHNFLIPEVDKQITRKKIHDRQQEYLRAAHLMICNEVENSGSTEKFEGNSEESLRTEFPVGDAEDSEGNESANDEDIDVREEIKKST